MLVVEHDYQRRQKIFSKFSTSRRDLQHKNIHEYGLHEYDFCVSFCWTVNRICVIVDCFLGLLQYLLAVMRVFPKAIVHTTEPRIDALHFLASRRSLMVRTIAFRKTVCIYYVYKNRNYYSISLLHK